MHRRVLTGLAPVGGHRRVMPRMVARMVARVIVRGDLHRGRRRHARAQAGNGGSRKEQLQRLQDEQGDREAAEWGHDVDAAAFRPLEPRPVTEG